MTETSQASDNVCCHVQAQDDQAGFEFWMRLLGRALSQLAGAVGDPAIRV